jgi:hypothetical protein
MSKEDLNELFTNNITKTVLLEILLYSKNESRLLSGDEYIFNYFRFRFISKLQTNLVIIFFGGDHKIIFVIFKNSPAYRERNNLLTMNPRLIELLAKFRGTLSVEYINKRIYSQRMTVRALIDNKNKALVL